MQIIFEGEKTIETSGDQSILDASLNAGIPHFHACGGKGKCSTCRILILEGAENLAPLNKIESFLRTRIPFPEKVRLACQTIVEKGDVKVERIIKDEKDFSLFIADDLIDRKTQQLGVQKELVLFFLDIKNFTPFVETYLPFDVIHVTRRLFYIFHKAIQSHGGKIVETAGDGLYAVFGLKGTTKDASDNSILAARLIADELHELNESYLQKYFFTSFEVGIGIHLGKVIVGKVTVGENSIDNIMGLAVNIAARLQASTRSLNNNIIISEYMAKHSSVDISSEKKSINLKGVNRKVNVFLIGKPFKVVK